MPPFADTSHASSLANDVYANSKKCLMAHSIRAAESYLFDRYNVVHHIRVIPKVFGSRKSYCLPGPNISRIHVNPNLLHDEKRFCIAHELYHVLHKIEATLNENIQLLPDLPDDAKGSGITSQVFSEQLCDLFAKDLCDKHNAFYQQSKNVDDHCKFKRTNFNSLEGIVA